ncbi:SGNH/GDSL hydrolase family protein [Rhodococcus sp. NPDC056743]|uniref:SGNH/GDSL hydrolase family protein n=1 Tax=Rhodococcus sp. NPDC056743 TaxID=3345934 RepID=UPI00366AA0BF
MINRGMRFGSIAATVVGLVLTLAGAGAAHASVPVDAGENEGIKYTALGDSRASGPRLEPMYPDGCSRSYENFAGKISRELAVEEFADVSCSAARSENIISTPQLIPTQWPVQLDAVHPDTNLITLSVGGNDSNTLIVGALCASPAPGVDRRCRTDPLTESLAQSGIDQAADSLDKTLAALTARAPQARIYMVGAGGMIGARACWPNVPFSDGDAAWFMNYYARFNTQFAAIAGRYGVHVIDIATDAVAGGHDACAAPEQRWFEGMFSESTAQRLHFTASGMTEVADRIVADLRANPIGVA